MAAFGYQSLSSGTYLVVADGFNSNANSLLRYVYDDCFHLWICSLVINENSRNIKPNYQKAPNQPQKAGLGAFCFTELVNHRFYHVLSFVL